MTVTVIARMAQTSTMTAQPIIMNFMVVFPIIDISLSTLPGLWNTILVGLRCFATILKSCTVETLGEILELELHVCLSRRFFDRL